MKVDVTFGLGAVTEVTLKDGRKLNNDDIRRISITPFFTTDSSLSDLVNLAILVGDKEEELGKTAVAVSGRTGAVALRRLSVDKSAVPRIDKAKNKAATPKASNENK